MKYFRFSGSDGILSGNTSPPPQRGRPSQSRFACQLSQRESQGSCAPFLPPAFMRGEGHAVAGGVPRSGGESLLSHGFAVPAPPEGKPRALRAVLAPRIYEGGGPRSGRGSPPPQRGRLSQSRFACQLSQRESQGGGGYRSPLPFSRGIPTALPRNDPQPAAFPSVPRRRKKPPPRKTEGAGMFSLPFA